MGCDAGQAVASNLQRNYDTITLALAFFLPLDNGRCAHPDCSALVAIHRWRRQPQLQRRVAAPVDHSLDRRPALSCAGHTIGGRASCPWAGGRRHTTSCEPNKVCRPSCVFIYTETYTRCIHAGCLPHVSFTSFLSPQQFSSTHFLVHVISWFY